MAYRYALYFSPPTASALGTFGASWLGRTIEGKIGEPPPLQQITLESWTAATAAPRSYGFHATLKPPFRLAPDVTEQDLYDAVATFSRNTPTVPLGILTVQTLPGFIALLPGRHDKVSEFAGKCVGAFDRFRASLSEEEIARRRPDTLTDPQKNLLDRWGYPYVMNEFRFHMTLTGDPPSSERALFMEELKRRFGFLDQAPASIDDICVFRQQTPESDFIAMGRYPLGIE